MIQKSINSLNKHLTAIRYPVRMASAAYALEVFLDRDINKYLSSDKKYSKIMFVLSVDNFLSGHTSQSRNGISDILIVRS